MSIRSALGLFGLSLLCSGCSTTPLPTDPTTSGCTVDATEFNSWFEGGAVTLNGVVKPADSVAFPDTPNCSFYQWSEQMFLWLNSPAPPKYGGGDRIFKSPAFFDVSPLDSNLDRTLIPHASGRFIDLSLRAAQVGSHGLPVIIDTSGTMFEIVPPTLGPNGKQLILNDRGQPVEVERIEFGDNIAPRTRQPPAAAPVRPIFFDPAGNAIQRPRPLLRKELDQARVVHKFVFDRRELFLDPLGTVVVPEQGQADGAVLMAQNGSLVFYQIAVNDVYTYFLTGAKNGVITPGTHFPTTQAELDDVIAFAAAHGRTLVDPEALAIEIKTAWVETTGLDASKYITMKATIPTFDQSDPNRWTPNGQKTATLAMVAMHVVGSTFQHPEMIWATFEHESNTPSGAYAYVSSAGPTKSVNPDFSSTWLFCAANPDLAHLNEVHMQLDFANPDDIVSVPPFTISPSNIIRGNAWGAVAGVGPNPLRTEAASNSEIIAINNAVRGMLASGDLRGRYIMTGATWTIGGAAGDQNFGNPGNTGIVAGRAVGTSQLANSTMETYQQGFPTSFNKFSNNCFSCHPANTTSVSHIYSTPGAPGHGLKPLFPP